MLWYLRLALNNSGRKKQGKSQLKLDDGVGGSLLYSSIYTFIHLKVYRTKRFFKYLLKDKLQKSIYSAHDKSWLNKKIKGHL